MNSKGIRLTACNRVPLTEAESEMFKMLSQIQFIRNEKRQLNYGSHNSIPYQVYLPHLALTYQDFSVDLRAREG